MNKTALLFFVSMTILHATPEPGVSLALARDRAASITALRYNLSFYIPAKREQPLRGTVGLQFALKAPREVVLDFDQPRDHVGRIVVNRVEGVRAEFVNGHIVLPASAMRAGENVVSIEFTPGDDALNRSDEFLYTLFVPARARLTFPCFDQPDLKARYRLQVGVPHGWVVVANGEGHPKTAVFEDNEVTSFDQTPPLSTYLFSFAAGKFQVETAVRNGRTFHMYHRETDAAKVARNREALFDLHAKALAWMEDYTQIKYPWGKFDFVLIPSFQFGGMEHPGAILYNASSLMLDEAATQNQLLDRASTIAHETAHMWFGDLVTMRWFNDVWMKEVMANFMAAKIVNPSFPEVNHDLRFLLAYYPSAYDVDRTEGTNPIRQQLGNLNEAGSLYGPIIYDKAPIVMRNLERITGEQKFRDGVREYLKRFSYGNATWLDLVKILDDRTEENVSAWSHAWVEERGRPAIEASWSGTVLTFTQRDPLKRNLMWPQQLDVEAGYAGGPQHVSLELRGASVKALAFRENPLYVLPTGGGFGYGDFALDAASRRYFLNHAEELRNPVSRASAIVVLGEELLDQRVKPAEMLKLCERALPVESDEQITQLLLSELTSIYWQWLPKQERAAKAPELEALLRAGLGRAKTASEKAAWFGAYRSVAATPGAIAWLTRLWNREEKIEGLPLAEQDEIGLAHLLAVREAPGWEKILAKQLERTENPDRKARFEFVMPALSADPAIRAKAFERLRDLENRRKEAWALESLTWMNHPLRADSSETFLRPALDLLPEIQRTGDIFFPQRWASALLGGRTSAESARIVREFLKANPNLNERLRWNVLAAADDLFRISGN